MDGNVAPPPTHLHGSKILQGAMIAAAPVWLLAKGGPIAMWGSGGWMIRSLMVGAAPSVVLCGLGVIEGLARMAIAGVGTAGSRAFGLKQISDRQWKWLEQEFHTTLGLVEGMLCPPVGSTLCVLEGFKWEEYDEHTDAERRTGAAPRSLIHDYVVYRASYEGYRGTRFVTKNGLRYSWKTVKWTALRVNDVLDFVGFWKGVRLVGTTAAKCINVGLGLAFSLLPSGDK